MYEIGNSAQIAAFYGGISFSLDELKNLDGKITKECWRYLSGKYCKAECEKHAQTERSAATYKRLEEIFGCTYSKLRRTILYAEAIDRISKIFPKIAADILNGKTRLPLEETVALSHMKFHEINDIMMRLSAEKTSAKTIICEQIALRQKRQSKPKKTQQDAPSVSIKDTPIHDPDARLNALSYTIPSWRNMIEKAFDYSEWENVSRHAREKLAEELEKISGAANALCKILSEVKQ
ncbi:MAG: hypothetical protein FWB96_07970 [Defluviitaleaceae bacterium]|nr:hypothetical protein [Defluviitaleaceae bacterium]MCL2262848.1 hypothetical protein [Defluviitaleaceae bacterium]